MVTVTSVVASVTEVVVGRTVVVVVDAVVSFESGTWISPFASISERLIWKWKNLKQLLVSIWPQNFFRSPSFPLHIQNQNGRAQLYIHESISSLGENSCLAGPEKLYLGKEILHKNPQKQQQ